MAEPVAKITLKAVTTWDLRVLSYSFLRDDAYICDSKLSRFFELPALRPKAITACLYTRPGKNRVMLKVISRGGYRRLVARDGRKGSNLLPGCMKVFDKIAKRAGTDTLYAEIVYDG